MAEYIEREAALNIVKRTSGDYAAAWAEISKLPAENVEPVKRGHWIKDKSGVIYCSKCEEEHAWLDYRASYCDTCGAKMQEVR